MKWPTEDEEKNNTDGDVSACSALISLFSLASLPARVRTRPSSPRARPTRYAPPLTHRPHLAHTPACGKRNLAPKLRAGRGRSDVSRLVPGARARRPLTHTPPRVRPTLTPAHFPTLHSRFAECQVCFHPHTPALTPMPSMRCVFGCGCQQRKNVSRSLARLPPKKSFGPSKKGDTVPFVFVRPLIRRAREPRLVNPNS